MDIKDFAKHSQKEKPQEKSKEFDAKQIQNDYGDLVEEFLKRYGKMDEKQMLFEMFELVKQKKEEGTFDITQIENACKSISPFLDAGQREYMQSLLEKLRWKSFLFGWVILILQTKFLTNFLQKMCCFV